MLVIRAAQMNVFSKYQRERFVDEMVEHIEKTYPDLKKQFPMDIRTFVSAGIEKAERYEIEYKDDIRAFLEMTARLGPQFDSDPQYPWAVHVLSDGGKTGSAKVAQLQEYEAFAR